MRCSPRGSSRISSGHVPRSRSALGVGLLGRTVLGRGSFGINYLFERRSLKLFLINGGYHTLQFTIIGLVLALLPCTIARSPARMKVERKADHAVSESLLQERHRQVARRVVQGARQTRRHRPRTPRVEQVAHGRPQGGAWWSSTIVNEYEIARGDLAKDGKPKGYSICPTKSIKASAQDCFAAFATPRRSTAWFGPKHDVDLREGGHWRNADGNRATIRKVNAGKNIRLIAEDEGLTLPTPVEIKFEGKGDKCTVMVSIERLQTRAEADGYRRAWGDALDRLKAHVEAS